MRTWLLRGAIALVALLALAQLVPYGREHSDPPVTGTPRWSSPRTLRLAESACFDCHSNLTRWPWYSDVAPVSWLVTADVDGGRAALNFSEWDRPQEADTGEIGEIVRSGEMPPMQYRLLHPAARLSGAERAALAAGLEATLRRSPPAG